MPNNDSNAAPTTRAPNATRTTRAPNATRTTRAPNATRTTRAPNATRTTRAPNAARTTRDTDLDEEDPVLIIQMYVLTCIVLMVSVTPIIVGIYTTLYLFVYEAAYICSKLIVPLLNTVTYYLLVHCHIAFIYTFVAVALVAFTVAMWRSTNYGVRIHIRQE